MRHYLVELYRSRLADPLDEIAVRLQANANALTASGTPTRYVRTIFVPDDEICFYLIEARSQEAAAELARRTQLPFERVLEAETDSSADAETVTWWRAHPKGPS